MNRAHLPNTLTEALEPQHGIKAKALATAYERFTVHHNRPRFNAEVQAIHGCVLIAFLSSEENRCA